MTEFAYGPFEGGARRFGAAARRPLAAHRRAGTGGPGRALRHRRVGADADVCDLLHRAKEALSPAAVRGAHRAMGSLPAETS